VLILVVFGALAVRVAQLQVFSGNRYKNLALRQTTHTVPLPAQRGTIFDRDGRDLALSIELSSVYADPQQVSDPIAYAGALAPILGVSETTLEERLAQTNQFQYLARRVNDATVEQVKALDLPGVGFVPEQARQYPAGSLAGSLIGEVGGEGTGLSGLEKLYEDVLRGQDGEMVVERDQEGQEIPNTSSHRRDARRGTDMCSRWTSRCSGRPSSRSSTRSAPRTRRAAWPSSSTSRPETCSRSHRWRVLLPESRCARRARPMSPGRCSRCSSPARRSS